MTDHPDPDPTVADRVAAAVLAVPGVHALHAGVAGEVATYLPGRRVDGVRVRDDVVAVHVSVVWGASLTATSDLVRAAAREHVTGPVDVTVEDVVEVDGPEPGPRRRVR